MADANKRSHTPGPWRIAGASSYMVDSDDHDYLTWTAIWAGDQIIALPCTDQFDAGHVVDANARMIAAAPEMETSLRELLAEIDFEIEQRQSGGNDEDWLDLKAKSDRGHAALAKAKGAA